MAMAMGVASLAVTAPRNASLVCRASANKGQKEGFLDWFRDAFDKESLSETGLNKLLDDGKSSNGKSNNGKSNNGKAAPARKKGAAAPAPKKDGFNFFGKK